MLKSGTFRFYAMLRSSKYICFIKFYEMNANFRIYCIDNFQFFCYYPKQGTGVYYFERWIMEQENIKHVKRDTKEIKRMLNRLSVIEGQVRGVKKMLEEDRYCVDILTQVSSIQAALNGFNKQLLAQHIKSCVCDDIRAGNDNAVDELCELLKNLMK